MRGAGGRLPRSEGLAEAEARELLARAAAEEPSPRGAWDVWTTGSLVRRPVPHAPPASARDDAFDPEGAGAGIVEGDLGLPPVPEGDEGCQQQQQQPLPEARLPPQPSSSPWPHESASQPRPVAPVVAAAPAAAMVPVAVSAPVTVMAPMAGAEERTEALRTEESADARLPAAVTAVATGHGSPPRSPQRQSAEQRPPASGQPRSAPTEMWTAAPAPRPPSTAAPGQDDGASAERRRGVGLGSGSAELGARLEEICRGLDGILAARAPDAGPPGAVAAPDDASGDGRGF
uniref:Uncharacterized protein n=1 Tax=Alexandrium monilatum TaxID=311494 RepID=A0A7S4UE32_9DINO